MKLSSHFFKSKTNEVVIYTQVLGVTFTFKLQHLENVLPKWFLHFFF